MKRLQTIVLGIALACTQISPLSAAETKPAKKANPAEVAKNQKDAADFFAGPILRLKIAFTPEQKAKLGRDERNYAEGTISEVTASGESPGQKVMVKLKGSTGTFQHLGGRPSLTLNFDKPEGGTRYHGMKKLHLNNEVQDITFLSELMAGEVARKAGVPASRCTHVFLELNGRNVGIYLAKEAFTKDFLSVFYKNTGGDLYDGGSYKEINEGMKKDQGDPKDIAALKELVAACQDKDPDPAKRWERLNKILDVEKYMKFTALESVVCHWDGYNYFNHNNYRIYRDPDTGKFSFFMHGMDNCFGDENFSMVPNFKPPRGPMVGAALMSCPQGPPMYWAAAKSAYETIKKENWGARVEFAGTRLRDAIAEKDPARASNYYEKTVKQAMLRIPRRIANVGRQLQEPFKPFFMEKSGVNVPRNAWVLDTSTGGMGDIVKLDGRTCLHLVSTGTGVPAWKQKIQLEAGRYRMGSIVGVLGVESNEDEHGRGGGLWVTGAPKRSNVLEGDGGFHPGIAGGQSMGYEFETKGGEVELVFELRAKKGEVWLALDNFGMTRGE